MSGFTIVSDYGCPACDHRLRKQITLSDTIWLHCANMYCKSLVCDNGQEAATEEEAYNVLVHRFETEPQQPEPEIELSSEEKLAEWRFENRRGDGK